MVRTTGNFVLDNAIRSVTARLQKDDEIKRQIEEHKAEIRRLMKEPKTLDPR